MSTTCPPLHSPWQVTGAAFLGGPAAGLWLISNNFKAIGWEEKAKRLRVALVTIFLAILAFALYGPELKGAAVFGAICAGLVRQYALMSYGKAYKQHLDEGGQRKSNWRWIGAGAAGLLISFVVAIAYIFGLASVAPFLLPSWYHQ